MGFPVQDPWLDDVLCKLKYLPKDEIIISRADLELAIRLYEQVYHQRLGR